MHRLRLIASVVLVALLPFVTALPAVAAQTESMPVNIYLVALDDGGQSGQLIGCNDSLVPVDVQIDATGSVEARLQAALEELFAIDDQFYGASGLYNALYQSDLTVDTVTITGGAALIEMSGSLLVGGVCDNPRIEHQIKQTVLQFPEVSGVALMVNGNWFLPSNRGSECFDATGYCVSHEFLTFWEDNGGLPVFGYPIGTVTVEDGRIVQYFERQRFEYHPENDAPFTVLLGLLGRQAADARGLLDHEAFQPVDAASDAHCLYVAQTQHRVCHGFARYWASHGLNFGDEGVSFREALMLFGYPISDEFVNPATGLTTQYFERAVFEWQPGNQPPWDVLLQRIGAESL